MLRTWNWRLQSSSPLGDGLICWRQRFLPFNDAHGVASGRTEPADSLIGIGLREDDNRDIYLLAAPQEDGDSVTAFEVSERDQVRYVYLTPRRP